MVQIHPPLPTTMIKKDIELFLGPIIEASGCEIWGIEVTSGKGKGRILRIFIVNGGRFSNVSDGKFKEKTKIGL